MRLTIELTPTQEARLNAAAAMEGIDLTSLAQKAGYGPPNGDLCLYVLIAED